MTGDWSPMMLAAVDAGARALAKANGYNWDGLTAEMRRHYDGWARNVLDAGLASLEAWSDPDAARIEAVKSAFNAAAVPDGAGWLAGMDAARFEAALREAGYEILPVEDENPDAPIPFVPVETPMADRARHAAEDYPPRTGFRWLEAALTKSVNEAARQVGYALRDALDRASDSREVKR